MASNQFLSSPFSLPEIASEDVSVEKEAPKPIAAPRVAARGLGPTRDDIIKRARELDVDPNLALSFFSQESSGNWDSKDSPKGARGGFQVMPGTYRAMMGTDAGQRDPWNNLEAGIRYIRYGQDTLKTRDPQLLAAGYHAGYDRKDLKAGRIPNTNDGMITTAAYAKSVAARAGGGGGDIEAPASGRKTRFPNSQKPTDVLSQLNAEQPGLYSIEEEPKDADPVLSKLNAANPGLYSIDTDQASPIPTPQEKSYIDRLISETKSGFGDMTSALTTARWALGGGDDASIAEQMAQNIAGQQNAPKNAAQKEIDAAYQDVTNAKGVVDTTVAGAKALWKSATNPKETSIEIARNAANSLPTLAAGTAGAGAGGVAGSVVPGVGTAVGAIAGGRTGMAVGTTATELGAEIQDMVQKRLADANVAPTAQNVLAVLSDKGFKEEARAQGLKKGLTVAAVDQLFMGIGGKIATAPAKKIASKELADKGMDMATRSARKAALATPAGQAAVAAAKPTVGAKVAAGATAVGVDAAGESLGEGLSQQVARGNVDYGDALREGVASLGQSVAETGAGATIESAKVAARAGKAAIQPTERSPSTASGPLARATDNAAADPERVTVTAPDGKVSGTVAGTSPDGKVVQIVGDDGEVYSFATGDNGVQITPEAPNTPLSNAVEVASMDEVSVTPEQAPVVAQAPVADAPVAAPQEVRTPNDDGSVSIATWTPQQDGSFKRSVRVEPAPKEAPKVEAPAPKVEVEKPAPVKALADMDEPELRSRMKYIADQAKTNGWNSMLVKSRREVEKEINKRVKDGMAKFAPETGTLGIPREEMPQVKSEHHGALVNHLNAQGIEHETKEVDATTLKPTQAEYSPEKVERAKEDGNGERSIIVSSDNHIIDGHHQALAAAENGEPVKAIVLDAPAKEALDAVKAFPSTTTEADTKRKKALERIAKGTAYFHDGVKAKDFITKNGIGDTHEAKKGKAGRWDIVAKETAEESSPVQTERTYNVVAVNEKTGDKTVMTNEPVTHTQAVTIKSKISDNPARRIQLEESNVSDERTSGEPASAETVVSSEEAKPAEAPTVQPDAAPKEVAAKRSKKSQTRRIYNEDGSYYTADVSDQYLSYEKWIADGKQVSAGMREQINADERLYEGESDRLLKMAGEPSKKKDDTDPTDPTPPTGGGKPDPFAKNKIFTSDAVEKARARLKSKLTQINSGIDPEMVMDGLVVAGAYIESGVRTFSAYSKAMIEDLGEEVKPYLLSFYEAARHYPGVDSDGMSSPASARAQHEAMMLDKAETDRAKAKASTGKPENDNESAKLDQPSARELEGKQPESLQVAEPNREAGGSSEGGSREDARRDERAGSERVQQSGSVGVDAGEVSASATGADAGRGGKQGGRTVQRSKRAAKQDPAIERNTGGQSELEPETGTRAQDRADGFVITDEDAIGEGGAKTKFKQNVAAIRLLKQLTAENRQATRAEQAILAKYVGWGGLPQAFYRDNNEVTKGWEKEVAELKGLMTDAELAAAAASTRNAHYTSPEIVGAVWEAAKQFGFQGGRTLEPSVGVGNFFGLMPTDLRSASQLTGVELDHITGGIAKQLYPQANINAPVGFQDFSAPDNYFDLAIGNPPFGQEGIYDANRRKISGFSIHNYFFAKSIDTVKPNGVLAMVVTNRMLDSVGDKARQYIADRAELLGAIRLPNDAFMKNAGTAVTTDIVFLRKLKDGEAPTGAKWMDVKQVTDANGKTVPLNEYFVKNPDMMLGEFGAFGTMYRPDDAALVARPGQDTPALLQAAIAKLPKGFMDGPTAEPTRETIEPMHDISRVKVGSVFEQGGQLFERREDMLGKQQAIAITFANEKAKERVAGMIGVRDALVEVRRLQLEENATEAELAAARAELNKLYDAFVKTNSPLNADANKRLMRDDPTWPQIAALEDGFDKGISAAVAKTTGEKARPASAKKSAIFFKRTQAPYHAPSSAASAKDAMVSSLAERGRVDLDYMASLYGKSPEEITKELDGLIFKNPIGGWESRDQYLSGNVKKKLAQAIDAAKQDPSLNANVDALKTVQPADIEAVDIDVKTGAHWMPADVMKSFIEHITNGQNAKAVYNPVNASWTLSADRIPASNSSQWSTDRANILAILEAASNQKQITIYDKHYDGSRTLNEAATTAANEKVERVKAEWKGWIWSDDSRRERLARIYNDTFNTDVQREFDGSHLKFHGKVGDDIIQLRPHQANAVWRMVQSGTTLLDHVVGAGKTFTMIAGIMEMRRMGMAKKPMLVVPNHLVGQWAEDFMKLYPGANILAATKKDFEKDSRKRLFARIATGDWDAVIVAHSSFGKVEVEPEFQSEFIKQQIEDMDTSIKAMREAEGKGSRNVKQIEKQKASLEEKLKKLFDTGSKDDNLYFSELGVDAVLLDEAHEFKNLGFSTGMQRVAGLGNPAGSNKAADMFMKVQATLKRTGGKNVVFATGTPISNTMAEMYTMQRFLDYGTLKDQGISHFDAWAKTFGEVVTDWELSPSGQYKMNSRFAKFVNMPELMQRYQSFADVVNRDDINRMLASQGKKLPVPKLKGGKPENTVVERSRDQAAYIGIPQVDENGNESYPKGSLVYRAENLPKKAVKGGDNMLKIMSDARKAALDMRLIDPNYPDNPDSKVNVSAKNIKDIYDKWDKDKGTQLVFIDLSTPKGAMAKEAGALRDLVAKAEEGDEAAQEKLDRMSPDELLALESDFSVYDDLKQKLINKGIPANEIAFIHDANTELQKEDLFGKVRSGRVRVLFGSTAKMGAGMNVQERLVALHHLDAPWRPSDLEQREGRIIRQGNKLYDADPEGFEVEVKRYATKQTLDSRMWQTIEAKARFIEQVRKGTGERQVEDVAGEASNSAEMKAASSGNPLILEEMSLRQAIRKLENQQTEHNREQFRINDRIRWMGDQIKRREAEAEVIASDVPSVPKEFAVKIGKQTFEKHGEAGEAILAAVDAMFEAKEESREIGTYGGFKLTVDDVSRGIGQQAILTVKGNGEYQVEANPGSSATGLGLRLQNTIKSLKSEADRLKTLAENDRADLPKLKAQLKPWGHDSELSEAKARHMAVIDQLKPKKKEAAKPKDGETPSFSRSNDMAQYVEDNFLDILEELDDSGTVLINCP